MKLSNVQVDFIRTVLIKNGIEIPSLRDDLLDHVCCYVETRMARQEDFEQLVKAGLDEVAPFGLRLLQQETFVLLHSDKLLTMKKIMFFTGALSAMAFVTGWSFSLMRYPGGRELSFYGFLSFVFVYLPMLAIINYRTSIKRSAMQRWKFISGIGSGVLVATAFTFKALHLAGVTQVLLSGTFLFVLGFLPFLFFDMYKKSLTVN